MTLNTKNLHNWILRQRWLWKKTQKLVRRPAKLKNLKEQEEEVVEYMEWEHLILGYVSNSNFRREFKEVWPTFERKK